MSMNLEKLRGWQPIETAPREGEQVLLAPQMMVGWWEFGDENWQVLHIHLNHDSTVADDWTVDVPKRWYCLAANAWGQEPTHWMPLPEPPQ